MLSYANRFPSRSSFERCCAPNPSANLALASLWALDAQCLVSRAGLLRHAGLTVAHRLHQAAPRIRIIAQRPQLEDRLYSLFGF